MKRPPLRACGGCFLLLVGILQHSGGQTVPSHYQPLYNELTVELARMESTTTVHWQGITRSVQYCVELTPAGGNRTVTLLEPNTINGVYAWLSALDSLGVDAVSIALNYPLLVPDYPRSQEFLQFYRKVLNRARLLGMKILVASQTVFRDSTLATVDSNIVNFYSGLSKTRYKSEKRLMIQTIIDSLRPDYLTVENEPGTMEMNTGLPMFSPPEVEEYVRHFLNELDKKGVQIGAGCGTWESLEFINRLVQVLDLDFLDIHVYPIFSDFFADKVFTIATVASQANKKMIVGECWLYKQSTTEPSVPGIIYGRDAFSFWLPLDSRFLTTMVRYAQVGPTELLSFWGTTYLFGTAPFQAGDENITLKEASQLVSSTVTQNILNKTFAPLGDTAKSLYRAYRLPTSIELNEAIESPKTLALHQNYPNPFNPSTNVDVRIAGREFVSVKVFDLFGRVVATLLNEEKDPGYYSLRFDTRHVPARWLSSGVYYYRLQAGSYSETKKMILVQ